MTSGQLNSPARPTLIYPGDTVSLTLAERAGVDELVEEVLAQDLTPYLKEIRRRSAESSLAARADELRSAVRELHALGFVDTNEDSVDSWLGKVRTFRENEDLIREIVFDRHRIPDPLDSQNRRLVLETIKDLWVRFGLAKSLSRTQRAVKLLLENGGSDIDSVFESLAVAARADSAAWQTKSTGTPDFDFKMPSQEAILAILPRIRDFFDIEELGEPQPNGD